MRNTLPLLSRAPAPSSTLARSSSPMPPADITPQEHVPTIRLISATPSAAGSAGDASTSFASSSYASIAPPISSPLAPKQTNDGPRKRIVPKKSKLGLLGGSKTKEKSNKDFSDVVRRVGGAPSTGRGGFEIYVDQNDDPDLGEILVVKKKKSRLGLDGMKWGTLGEVTNVPSAPKDQKPAPGDNLLKVKGDESQKWWSIGRGRKDSKSKDKEQKPPARSKTPEPSKPLEGRGRFNSLDSGILLNSPASRPEKKQGTVSSVKTLLEVPVIETTPPDARLGENAVPMNGLLSADGPPTGSIAVRAIRSMRSLARMASWAQLSNDKEGNAAPTAPTETVKSRAKDEKKTKEKDEKKSKEKGDTMKKKKKKEKEKTKEKESSKEKEMTIRYSGSSFEAGALSAQASPAPIRLEDGPRTLGSRKKQSVLGLGLPSTMRLSTVRDASGSSTGSFSGVQQAPQRLSVDSAHLILNAQGRPSSILSSGSSLRPPSTASGISTFSSRSPRSSSSSVASVRWDETNLQTAKERQRKERRTRREKDKESGKTTKESRRSSDSRRRTPISEIFPQAQMEREPSLSPPASIIENPIVRVEEATADGHSAPTDDEREVASPSETPAKRVRPRPMSEQMLGRPRPQPICDDEEGDGMISILDAATNELASLIGRLDLEATPASTNSTPLQLSPFQLAQESPLKHRATQRGSPLKAELRESTASIASLRPYAKSQPSAPPSVLTSKPLTQPAQGNKLIGQQIAPWSELDWKVSPRKPLIKPKAAYLTHKRTITPSPSEPMPVFQPLRPATLKTSISALSSSSSLRTLTPPVTNDGTPSSRTFGSRSAKVGVDMSTLESTEVAPSPTPVFSRAGHHRKSSSLIPMNSKGSVGSLRRMGVQISPEARKGLCMSGTLGGSTEPDVDPEDPDSDIPDELQVILAGHSDDDMTRPLDDTMSLRPSSPGSPPKAALPRPEVESDGFEEEANVPVFHAQLFDAEANQADIDDGEGHGSASEDDTKKSFDFTGELQKLNESGASDRASFVEQLENAFKTPARIELGFDFGIEEGMLAPPLPALPHELRPVPSVDDVPRSFSNSGDVSSMFDGSDETGNRDSGMSQDHDISFMMRELEDECRVYPELAHQASMRSKPSDGHLNKDFRFGGKPSPQGSMGSEEASPRPLTLSDIIPPVSHSRSQSQVSTTEDDSVLKSILAKAADVLPAEQSGRPRVDSQTSFKPSPHVSFPEDISRPPAHSRTESGLSFDGFDSFDEVRRGFEFGPNRPAFWPPREAVFRPAHHQHESLYSIASISSYGAVVNSGTQDPFGYADGPSRPPSMDDMSMSMSMSMSVDDTFSFIRNKPRARVDSDASSFYFRAPGSAQMMHPYRRGHRRGPSALSIASNAPPVSLYNRSFAGHGHRKNDSNTSASSVALSYAMHGAGGGRAAWAQHSREYSVDSIMSDYSERPMARPGLGDKMFETSRGAPLSAISASPESTYSDPAEANRSSWDSIMDNDGGRYTSVEDSLFDKTRNRTSVSSESVFGFDPYAQYARPPPSHQFRPLSIMSEMSVHSPIKEDDTMISMLGGGHVRRRSVSSLVDASPCVRMERNKHTNLPGRVLNFDMEPPARESPKKTKLMEKPSIASTSSYQFGGERMIKARQGLLERQSLEDGALIAQGEDLLASLRERSIFSKPPPAARSRSSTCTSSSSGAETPPLSCSDGSSISGGSQSSIDLGHLNTILTNVSQPSSVIARARTRARARGMGHRRRIDEARMSRSSVYETIQEEASVISSSPSEKHPTPQSVAKHSVVSPLNNSSVYIVEGDSDSVYGEWDEEHGIMTLRHYYALRDEAQETVAESKRVWIDTPFSVFALQSFQPPKEPAVMQAMLEHSQKNYGPLPSELRPHRVRSRTSSRASPYPSRNMRTSFSPEKPLRASPIQVFTDAPTKSFAFLNEPPVLREVRRNANVTTASPAPALDEIKPFSPLHIELDTSKQGKTAMGLPTRPRVTSSTRRAALGWSKRTAKSSGKEAKENLSASMIIPTPTETLRINRPRPRGRPTPARVAVPAA